jgi:hypothetical protein
VDQIVANVRAQPVAAQQHSVARVQRERGEIRRAAVRPPVQEAGQLVPQISALSMRRTLGAVSVILGDLHHPATSSQPAAQQVRARVTDVGQHGGGARAQQRDQSGAQLCKLHYSLGISAQSTM